MPARAARSGTVGGMADDWVELEALPFPIAQIVKGALEAEGIPALVRRDPLGAVYGIDVGPLSTRLLVRAEDLPAARALVAEVEQED
jgi:hypothetical protein